MGIFDTDIQDNPRLEAAYQSMTPEQQAVFSRELKKLRKKVGRATADQIFNRIAKFTETAQGGSIAQARQRYNIKGPDSSFIRALYKQLGELGATAAQIDFDRASKIGDLAKKRVEINRGLMNILGRAVTAEGAFAAGVGKQRIAAISAQYEVVNKELAKNRQNIESDASSDEVLNKIPARVARVGAKQSLPDGTLLDINQLAENATWLDAVKTELKATPKAGDKKTLYKSLVGTLPGTGGTPENLTAILRTSKQAGARDILNIMDSAQAEEDAAAKEYGLKTSSFLRKAIKSFGASSPKWAETINEVANAVGGLDGTKGAQAALDKAIAGLIPKEGEKSPIDNERDRLLAALANEQDQRGPIQAAREQFWATPEFKHFAEKLTGRGIQELNASEKMVLTEYARKKSKGAVKQSKRDLRDLIQGREIEEETGKDVEGRVLPEEPSTEASQRPSAEIVQPPAVTDTVPETEDEAEYDSVQGRWQGKPVEMRLKNANGQFSFEVVQDGRVVEVIENTSQTAETFKQAYEVFKKSAEYLEKTGEQPGELFGMTKDEAADKAFEELGIVDEKEDEREFQSDLPDDPLGDFDDDFATQARQLDADAPQPVAPLTSAAPILPAAIEDIAPVQKEPDLGAEIDRGTATGLIRQKIHSALAGEAGEAGMSEEEALKGGPERLAKLLRLRQQRLVEAGTGR